MTDAGSGVVRFIFNDGTGNLTEPRDVRVCDLNNDSGGYAEIIVADDVDANGDDVVNIDDIVFVVLNFGSPCP